ncbi:MAG TPA: type II secretion system protein [bacterium (Candidatus Stahlbacteria)]|nr:type II secretion system protein [Candidatus Stahlbacteria bacterium]
MRKAFSMYMAIVVIVLMATVSAFILNISAKSVKSTLLQYKREQAILYARSYTELAIMDATAATANNTATRTITGTAGDNYTINVTSTPILRADGVTTSPFLTIDVFVSYPDYDSATPVVYHKRTLQKL